MKKLMILFIGLFMLLVLSGCNSTTGNATVEDEYVEISLSDITDTLQKYSYEVDGKQVNYFVVLGSDGEVRTAFDACDVCGGYRGYRQEGDDVVCNNCGKYFSIDDIGTKNGSGGCWPSFLDHEIVEDGVWIKVSDLEEGAFRF